MVEDHKPALFLDRDGTLIGDIGYPDDPERVAPLPGAVEALRELGERYLLVIISNQSGIGRGVVSPERAQAVHERVVACFAAGGVTFAGVHYCPHVPEEGCRCRKPAPGMLLDAARALAIDLPASVMIGDQPTDLEAGRAAGCGRVFQIGPAVNVGWAELRRLLA